METTTIETEQQIDLLIAPIELPLYVRTALVHFEQGLSLEIDRDQHRARFLNHKNGVPLHQVNYHEAIDIKTGVEFPGVRDWFDQVYPGRMIVIEACETSRNGNAEAPPSPAPAETDMDNAPPPDDRPFCSFVSVSPATAEYWLGKNTHNREMDQRVVKRYERLMKNDRFLVTGDAIQFDKSGRLINGQHRLQAIVNTRLEQTLLLVRGLEECVFKVLDYGKRRSPADALYIEGFVNSRNLAAMCKLIYGWSHGLLNNLQRIQVETDEIVDIAYRFDDPALTETITAALRFVHGHYNRFKKLLPLSYMSFVYWAYARLGEDEKERAKLFVEKISTGLGIRDGSDPAGQLRDILIQNALDKDSKLTDVIHFGMTIQAMRLHMAGEAAENLRWKDEFPQPGQAPKLQ